MTPRGLIQINFYSERRPIPLQTVHSIEDGKLGDEIEDRRVGKEGVVREMEVAAIVDLNAAKALRKWLDERITELQGIQDKKDEE